MIKVGESCIPWIVTAFTFIRWHMKEYHNGLHWITTKIWGKRHYYGTSGSIMKYDYFIILAYLFSTQDFAQTFLNHFYMFHGLLTSIMFDRDKIFTSLFWKELFKKLRVKLLMSFACHPQIYRQTERFNQCLETYVRFIVMYYPNKWYLWLSMA